MFNICVSRRASCQRGLTQNHNESINNMIWSKCPKRVHVAKADLLFLFVNIMKSGNTWKKVIFGIIKRKMWPKCYCRTPKRKQSTTTKCNVQNNRKIQETQTGVTSTTKAAQER